MALVDYGGYPEINATAMGDCYVVNGGRARFILFDWYKVAGIWQRRIVGVITRPIAGLREDQEKTWTVISQIKETRPPAEYLETLH